MNAFGVLAFGVSDDHAEFVEITIHRADCSPMIVLQRASRWILRILEDFDNRLVPIDDDVPELDW